MRSDVLQRLGLGALAEVRNNPRFPYKTGHLRNDATSVSFVRDTGFIIHFDTTIAHYIPYLEFGTKNSSKHIGFISERATADVINYLAKALHKQIVHAVYSYDGRKVGGVNG